MTAQVDMELNMSLSMSPGKRCHPGAQKGTCEAHIFEFPQLPPQAIDLSVQIKVGAWVHTDLQLF